MTCADFDKRFKALKLPKQVIDKIYRTNAETWYPGIKKGGVQTAAVPAMGGIRTNRVRNKRAIN